MFRTVKSKGTLSIC